MNLLRSTSLSTVKKNKKQPQARGSIQIHGYLISRGGRNNTEIASRNSTGKKEISENEIITNK